MLLKEFEVGRQGLPGTRVRRSLEPPALLMDMKILLLLSRNRVAQGCLLSAHGEKTALFNA